MEVYNLISFAGIFILMGIAWLFSEDKKNINYRVILWGVIFQLVFALFLFVVPGGSAVFLWINDAVVSILDSAQAGTRFVFGRLALPPGSKNEFGEESMGFYLAFQALPTIVFFSALMSLLYYNNIMQPVIRFFSRIFSKYMRISGAESLCAASNIFVGVESSLTIRPYLKNMTRSELTVVLTAGMATVASNVLGLYIFSLKEIFPTIAGHLISASFLSAPAAIIMAKIIVPESGVPETMGENVDVHYEKESSFFEAVINGANTGGKLIMGIIVLLLAVLGLVALMDSALGSTGKLIGNFFGAEIHLNLKMLLGYISYPFVLIMGVPLDDAYRISGIIGERLIVTEVASYFDLAAAMRENALVHPRSALITAYALCGFAHVASLSIFIGGIAAVVPERRGDLAKAGFKALAAATLATMMTGAVAGTFFINGSMMLGR